MAKGGLSSGKQRPASAVKKTSTSKTPAKAAKKPAIAILIGVGKPKMAKGGCSTKMAKGGNAAKKKGCK
jgi:hypothetical protein